MAKLLNQEWGDLKRKLTEADRFEKFQLGEPEQEYITSRGMEILGLHATDFVNKRLAPANPKNDGRQTPTKGHPVFIAQHATGCNDRASLKKFYDIEMGTALSKDQVNQIVQIILLWITEHID